MVIRIWRFMVIYVDTVPFPNKWSGRLRSVSIYKFGWRTPQQSNMVTELPPFTSRQVSWPLLRAWWRKHMMQKRGQQGPNVRRRPNNKPSQPTPFGYIIQLLSVVYIPLYPHKVVPQTIAQVLHLPS